MSGKVRALKSIKNREGKSVIREWQQNITSAWSIQQGVGNKKEIDKVQLFYKVDSNVIILSGICLR